MVPSTEIFLIQSSKEHGDGWRVPANAGFPGSVRQPSGTFGTAPSFSSRGFQPKEMSMKTTIPALTGAMLVLLAAPALAGRSTPHQREATRQLHLEAAQQAKSTNQQIASAN